MTKQSWPVMSSGTNRTVRTVVIASVIALVTFVTAATVYASIPSAEGVITSCYKANGTLRVIDAEQDQCKKGEKTLTWNIKGEAGVPGPKGDPGSGGGLSGYEMVRHSREYVTTDGWDWDDGLDPNLDRTLSVTCPTGKHVLGGGFSFAVDKSPYVFDDSFVLANAPTEDNTGWTLTWEFRNGLQPANSDSPPFPVTVTVQVYASCATVD